MADEELLDRLTDVFREQGYEGASLSRLAEAADLRRASLYHRFPGGKQAMAAAVLAHVQERFADEVLAALDEDGTPEERLKALGRALSRFYEKGDALCPLGSLTIGPGIEHFGEELRDAFRELIGRLAAVARDGGVPTREARKRAEDAVVRLQGALILGRGLDDRGPFRRAIRELDEQLLAPA